MVQMVREGAETGYLPNSSDFIKEFEVSRHTVGRDLDFLRDEERAPLARLSLFVLISVVSSVKCVNGPARSSPHYLFWGWSSNLRRRLWRQLELQLCQ